MATVTLRSVKGSALTFTEMDNNFTNLNTDKLESVASDTTPQLGGNLDVNGNSIVSASNGDIAITPDGTGKIVLDGLNWPTADGSANYYLKTDGAGNLSWASVDTDTNTTYGISVQTDGANANFSLTGSDASVDTVQFVAGTNISLTVDSSGAVVIDATGTGIGSLVEDTTPQLGGTLDANGNTIDMGVNTITDTKVGQWDTAYGWGDHSTQNYITLTALSVGTEGSASGDGSVAYNNTTGVFTYTPPTAAGIGALANVVEDTTPQLGGALDCQGNDVRDATLEDYKETIHSLGSTDTPTITVSNGNVQSVTITSGLTLPAFSDAAAGQSVTLLVTGSGTASGTAAYKFAGNNTTLTSYSVVSIFYDGTTYWTSIATDFQ